MKKLIALFALACLCIGTFSCKKDTASPPLAPGPRVKTLSGSWGSVSYTYDALGRLLLAANSDGSKNEFEYLNGVVNSKVYNTSAVLTQIYTYHLGANGLAAKQTRMTDPAFEQFYYYNNENQVLKIVTHQNGNEQIKQYYYSNGSTDSARFTLNGTWTTTIKWTHYADKAETHGYEAFGESNFLGKDNKNLLLTEEYTSPGGGSNGITTYTYEWDAEGKILKETRTKGAVVNTDIYTY